MNAPPRKSPPTILWWIIWAAISAAVVVLYLVLQPPAPKMDVSGVQFLPIMPFLASAVVRWLILPKLADGARAFPIFIVGLALAEGCTILGVVLVPAFKQAYLALGLVGVAQYIPLLTSKYKNA